MLTVTEVAADLQLLSATELRVAAGLESSDSSQDATLATMGLRAAASLALACGVAKAGYHSSYAADSPPLTGEAPPTLRSESLSQTFRLTGEQSTLYLARRPVSAVASVTVTGSALAADGWELNVSQGTLIKLTSDEPCNWPKGKIVVAYDAGYATVPDGLKGYAARLVSLYYQSEGEDPNEKSVDIPDVIAIQRWVDAEADTIVPQDIMAGLLRDGYRKSVLA